MHAISNSLLDEILARFDDPQSSVPALAAFVRSEIANQNGSDLSSPLNAVLEGMAERFGQNQSNGISRPPNGKTDDDDHNNDSHAAPENVVVPDGYSLQAFATGLTFPTAITFSNNDVWVSESGPTPGTVP
jgi:hypothetical protein